MTETFKQYTGGFVLYGKSEYDALLPTICPLAMDLIDKKRQCCDLSTCLKSRERVSLHIEVAKGFRTLGSMLGKEIYVLILPDINEDVSDLRIFIPKPLNRLGMLYHPSADEVRQLIGSPSNN